MAAPVQRIRGERSLLVGLVLLVLTSLLPVLGFATILGMRIYDQQLESAGRALTTAARQSAGSLDRELALARTSLETLALSPSLRPLTPGSTEGFRAQAAAVAERFGAVIAVADATHILFTTAVPADRPPPPALDDGAVARALTTGSSLITGLRNVAGAMPLAYGVVTPVRQPQGAPLALLMQFPPQRLADVLGVPALPARGTMTVLDQAGRVLWRSQELDRLLGAKEPALRDLRMGENSLFRTSRPDGTPIYAAAVPVSASGWRVLVTAPQSAIDGAIESWLRGAADGALIALLVGLIISTVLARGLQRGIDRLIDYALALGQGRPPPPLALPITELNTLGAALGAVDAIATRERARRDASEGALRHAETALRRIERVAAIGEWNWDIASGAMSWSPGVYRLFDLLPAETPPSRANLIALVQPQDRPQAAAWLATLARDDTPQPLFFRLERGGSARLIRCESEPIRDAAGSLIRITGTFQDVTEQRRGADDTGRLTGAPTLARSTAPAAAATMTPLLEEAVDIAALIGTMVYMSERQARAAGIRLSASVAPEIRAVTADERRLKQALLVLLGNALKVTPRGGTVTLAARIEREGNLLIEVTDTGPGVPAPQLAALFTAALPQDHAAEAKGLRQVKHVIELHGGSFGLVSRPGGGASATVRLPADRCFRKVA